MVSEQGWRTTSLKSYTQKTLGNSQRTCGFTSRANFASAVVNCSANWRNPMWYWTRLAVRMRSVQVRIFFKKNHQSGITGASEITAGVIQDDVQVAANKLYIMCKLNTDLDSLFQADSVSAGCSVTHPDDVWYTGWPISHNLLSSMIKRLSLQAKLSKSYTNLCLRATTIVHLKEAGADDRRICEISGHRNTASFASYDRLSAHQAVSLSAAVDFKHVPETSVAFLSFWCCSRFR